MPKIYACIISPDISRDKAALVAVAGLFADSIEVINDGVLFDVSGLERLIGKPDLVARKVLGEMQRRNVAGSVAVADTVDTAKLLARQNGGLRHTAHSPETFEQLPLADLDIERDTLNVFSELGLRSIKDLMAVPHDDLVGRYGKQFTDVIDVLEQKGRSFVTPNVKENRVAWNYELDKPVEDFEQLIFLLNHGLDKLFCEVEHCGFSTEHLDISFRLNGKASIKNYEIKTSFPTLERAFWLKFINLRISLDPPEALIKGVEVTAHFAKERPAQRGLYAAARPEPESLLLTVGKLKKLVGPDNVGIPVLLNQRLNRPFKLDANATPDVATNEHSHSSPLGRIAVRKSSAFPSADLNSSAATPPQQRSTEARETTALRLVEYSGSQHKTAVIALNYLQPPVKAEVLIREGRLVFVRTPLFAGHIENYSGVWKGNSHWWDRAWRIKEWDIELENGGVYRLCKAGEEWFVVGEYD